MEKFSFLLFAFALISPGLADDDEPCVSEEVRECARSSSKVFDRHTIFLSDERLTNNCSVIQSSYDCTLDMIRSCHREELDNFLLATTSLKELIDDLCVETSTIRAAYSQHVSCLRTQALNTGLNQCFISIAQSAEEQWKEEGRVIQSEEEGYEFACQFYQPFRNCIKETGDTNCEEGAGDLLGQLLDRATELPREKFCKADVSQVEDMANSVFEEMSNEVVELFKRRK